MPALPILMVILLLTPPLFFRHNDVGLKIQADRSEHGRRTGFVTLS